MSTTLSTGVILSTLWLLVRLLWDKLPAHPQMAIRLPHFASIQPSSCIILDPDLYSPDFPKNLHRVCWIFLNTFLWCLLLVIIFKFSLNDKSMHWVKNSALSNFIFLIQRILTWHVQRKTTGPQCYTIGSHSIFGFIFFQTHKHTYKYIDVCVYRYTNIYTKTERKKEYVITFSMYNTNLFFQSCLGSNRSQKMY